MSRAIRLKGRPFLGELIQKEHDCLRLHLKTAFTLRNGLVDPLDNDRLLPTALELILSHRDSIGHVFVSGRFMSRLPNPKDRDQIWNALLDLPNIKRISFEGFEAPRSNFCLQTMRPLTVPVLARLLNKNKLQLKELEFNMLEIDVVEPEDASQLIRCIQGLGGLKQFRAQTVRFITDDNETSVMETVWSTVACLPEIESIELRTGCYELEGTLLSSHVITSICQSRSLKSLTLDGFGLTLENTKRLTKALTSAALGNGSPALDLFSLSIRNSYLCPETFMEILKMIEFNASVEILNVTGCQGPYGPLFINDSMIRVFARSLRYNSTLKKFYSSRMKSISSGGNKALYRTLKHHNHVLEHFNLEHLYAEDDELHYQVAELLALNKFGLRHLTGAEPLDAQTLGAALANAVAYVSNATVEVDRELLSLFFRLFSTNPMLMELLPREI